MSRETRIALLTLSLLLALVGVSGYREPPLIPPGTRPEPTATPALPSPTVTPTRTRIPTRTAVPTVTPTPMSTWTSGEEHSGAWKVRNCLRYLPLVHRWLPEEDTVDDPVLVLAVAAAESGCDEDLRSYAGAVGIMQVIPQPWTTSEERLLDPAINILWGMRVLHWAIERAEGDVRFGLALYNCSEANVLADRCGSKGGLNYADAVLHVWYPRIAAELAKRGP